MFEERMKLDYLQRGNLLKLFTIRTNEIKANNV